MPSGPKRRKAAKKKKEIHHNNSNPSSAHSHGDDDVKHQDDKGSDVGEVSSPGSEDHHSQHNLLTEGEEEEEIEVVNNITHPPSEVVKTEVVGNPNISVEESVVVPVERGFTVENEFNKKDGSLEHDESSSRKSYDGGSSGSSSSSSSSSDDESHEVKSGQVVADTSPVVDLIKVNESLSIGQAENINAATIEEANCSVVESGEKVEVDMSCATNTSVAPIVESAFEENGVENPSSIENKSNVSEAFRDVASQPEEQINPSVDNITANPEPKECATQETDDRLSLSYNAPPLASCDNGAYAEKDFRVTEPLLVPAPHPVRTTSWKSCCGLFEVFTGSGR